MLYFVKFCYRWVMPPGCIILALALLDIYLNVTDASGRYVLSFILLFFYLLSTRIVANILARSLETIHVPPRSADGDVLVLLGCGSTGGVPGIDGQGQSSGFMAVGIITAMRLYEELGIPILISGGTVYRDSGSEADIAAREMMGMGIPEGMILTESRSRNTVENAKYTKLICRKNGWRKPIVLVAAIQAPRTAMIFKRVGMYATIYPTHYRRSDGWHFNPVLDLVPNAKNMSDSAAAIREYMGILALRKGWQ